MENKLNSMIENCLLSAQNKTDRKNLITYYFEQFQLNENIRRISQLDETVFTRMYDRLPSKSELTKIRYWRCGYHIPANRQEMIRLGHALKLSEDEINQLLTNVLLETKLSPNEFSESHISMDNKTAVSATQQSTVSLKEQLLAFPGSSMPAKDSTNYTHWVLLSLTYRYLISLSPERLETLHIPSGKQFGQLRHILYSDIMNCLWPSDRLTGTHSSLHSDSLDFSSEINRYFKQGEKLSRIALIRLLLIFTMPDTNASFINKILGDFGFAPLSDSISTPAGISQDQFLLDFLEFFTSVRSGNMEEDRQLFQSLLRLCDENVVHRLKDIPETLKGSVQYQKRQQLKDLRIMALHSLRKELV